jgi:hypothetical protein
MKKKEEAWKTILTSLLTRKILETPKTLERIFYLAYQLFFAFLHLSIS